MSTVIAANWENQPSDQPTPESDLDWLDTVTETLAPEPRRIHVPRPLVWGFLAVFTLTIVAMGVWGLGHSTLTYGMTSVDAATTARLAQIQASLKEAGAPQAALRQMEIAAKPGVNIGDALEALVDADKALEPVSQSAMIASARQELRGVLSGLRSTQYWWVLTPASPLNGTPLPTLIIPSP